MNGELPMNYPIGYKYPLGGKIQEVSLEASFSFVCLRKGYYGKSMANQDGFDWNQIPLTISDLIYFSTTYKQTKRKEISMKTLNKKPP